jgi:hypothetical protein
LHQNDQGHQHCNQHVDAEENVNKDIHFRGVGIWLNPWKWQAAKNDEGTKDEDARLIAGRKLITELCPPFVIRDSSFF